MKIHSAVLCLVLAGCAAPISSATKTATQSAVDTVTSPQETKKLDGLVTSAVQHARDTALDDTTMQRAGTLRETLVGEPLRNDVDALIEHEKPKIADLVSTVEAPVAAEADKWRTTAIVAIAVLCGLHLLHLVLSFIERMRRAT